MSESASTPYVTGPRLEDDPGRPTLSVCIVGQDMAHRIGPLLEQASAIANEIVYVDGGSRDNSAAVVGQYAKARFIVRPFDGNIGRQKNFALDQALGEWALILDTDELLGPRFLTLLPSLLRSSAKTVKCPRYWLVDDAHFVLGKGIYPDRQMRLMRNRPELRYDESHPIHHPIARDGRRDPCLLLKGVHILHYCLMWQDRATREAKVRRYSRADPAAAAANRFYVYEDMPHRVVPCREWWREGRPMLRPDPLRAAVDRWRMWRIGRATPPSA